MITRNFWQILKKIATLNFRKFKVALNPMHRVLLNIRIPCECVGGSILEAIPNIGFTSVMVNQGECMCQDTMNEALQNILQPSSMSLT